MGNRLELHEILVEILGSRNVYFQPPATLKMNYPCIVYKRSTGDSQFGDNSTYIYKQRYQIIYIDKNPDNSIIEKIIRLPLCVYDRGYSSDNLNNDVLNIYY